LFSSSKKEKVQYGLAAFFCLMGATATFSRGVWLSLSLSAILSVGLMHRKKMLILAAALLAFFMTLFRLDSDFAGRIQSFQLSSNHDRMILWDLSLKMFQDSPLIGQGYHSFGDRMGDFSDILKQNPGFPKEAHSMYLDFLSTTGLLGFSAFIYFLLTCLKVFFITWKKLQSDNPNRPWILASFGGFAAFLIAGLFDRHFFMSQTLIPLLLFLGILSSVFLKPSWKVPETH
jgi:O-antigen ligase